MKIIQISEIKIFPKKKEDEVIVEERERERMWQKHEGNEREWVSEQKRKDTRIATMIIDRNMTLFFFFFGCFYSSWKFLLFLSHCDLPLLFLSASFSSSSFANGLHWWFVCMCAMFKHEKEIARRRRRREPTTYEFLPVWQKTTVNDFQALAYLPSPFIASICLTVRL